MLLSSTRVRTHLEYSIQLWDPQHRKDMKRVHKTVTRMITGQAERAGFLQTGGEKGPRRPQRPFSMNRVLLRKMRADFLVEPVVIRQGIMVLK